MTVTVVPESTYIYNTLSDCSVVDTVLKQFVHLILFLPPKNSCRYYSHFISEEMEACHKS